MSAPAPWRARVRRGARRVLGRGLLCAVLGALSVALAHASVELDAAGALLSPGGLTLGSAALAGLFVLMRVAFGVSVIVTAVSVPIELIGALWPEPTKRAPARRPDHSLEPWRDVLKGRFEPPPRASTVVAEPAWRTVRGLDAEEE